MKIAVASDQQMVAAHFGHCASFWIFQEMEGEIADCTVVPNPGHRPGFLPKFLHDLGVNVIIAGGMGQGAIQLFEEQGIEVITGASGIPEQVVQDYLGNKLELSTEPCKEHQH